MNLGAHILVAQRLVDDDPTYWLGAALPDIASMGGFRLLGTTANVAVAEGIAFHHRTDEAFHHHPWFTDIQGPLRDALIDAGLGRGPARAVAHVGPELLLDGQLINPPSRADRVETNRVETNRVETNRVETNRVETSNVATIGSAFDTLTGLGSELAPLVRAEHRDRWRVHLDRAAQWRPSDDDHQVEAVARRLHRILRRRPRLAFDVDQIEVVIGHLESVNEHIVATADTFVSDLVDVLREA